MVRVETVEPSGSRTWINYRITELEVDEPIADQTFSLDSLAQRVYDSDAERWIRGEPEVVSLSGRN